MFLLHDFGSRKGKRYQNDTVLGELQRFQKTFLIFQ